MDWETMTKLEPKLGGLLKEIQALPPCNSYDDCELYVWYGIGKNWLGHGFKSRMLPLVGWMVKGKTSVLCASEAYDIAYKKLWEAIPGCDTCKVHHDCISLNGMSR